MIICMKGIAKDIYSLLKFRICVVCQFDKDILYIYKIHIVTCWFCIFKLSVVNKKKNTMMTASILKQDQNTKEVKIDKKHTIFLIRRNKMCATFWVQRTFPSCKYKQIIVLKQTKDQIWLVLVQTPSTGLRHPSFNHCRI